jgi:hypothetical protein
VAALVVALTLLLQAQPIKVLAAVLAAVTLPTVLLVVAAAVLALLVAMPPEQTAAAMAVTACRLALMGQLPYAAVAAAVVGRLQVVRAERAAAVTRRRELDSMEPLTLAVAVAGLLVSALDK